MMDPNSDGYDGHVVAILVVFGALARRRSRRA
jgi:hypothetical protein